MKIGMTGGIGSGKNAAADLFEKAGFYTIDSDKLSRIVMAKGGTAYEGIIDTFGQSIIGSAGEIDRKKLGAIIFADAEKRSLLEGIVHPAIKELERKTYGVIKGRNSKAIIITHAALIVESGGYKDYDALIVIYCRREKQLERIIKRDGLNQEEAEKRIAAQMPMEEKLKYAHIIINNDTDEKNLEKEVQRVSTLINQIVYAEKHR